MVVSVGVVAGASVGAAAGTIPTTAVTGAGDRPIMAEVSVAHMRTTVGVGAADGVDIIPAVALLSTIAAWLSVPHHVTG